MGKDLLSPIKKLRVMLQQSRDSTPERDDEKDPLLRSERLPKDVFYLTYIILFLHGIGHLLPWNMFITAHEYFQEKFSCQDNTTATPCASFIADSFENFFALAAMLPVMITTAINIYIQSKIHFKYRMFSSLVVMLLLFILTSALVKVDTTKIVNVFFAVTLITIVLMNIFSGLFQSSTFGFAGILPQKYTAAVMSGQACAGLFSSFARIISSVATGNIMLSALLYFLSAVLVILICLASLVFLLKLPFVKYYMNLTSVRALKFRQEETIKSTVNVKVTARLPFCSILRSISVYSLSVCLVFSVTISLFPAICSSIKSSVSNPNHSIWTGKLFDALVCFLIFNCADFVGRYLSNWFKMTGRWRFVLLALTASRIIFVPLLLLCNVQPRSAHFNVLFDNDVWPVLFVTALGLSNGFLASLSMVSAPQCVPPEHRETASTFMSFFLCLGLIIGALLSFLYTYLIRISDS